MQTQARIGYLFAAISGLTYLGNFAARIVANSSLGDMIAIDQLYHVIYMALFLYSAVYIKKYTAIMQIMLVFIESLLSFTLNSQEWFWGAFLLIITILLAYLYGFLTSNAKIKLPIVTIIIYAFFSYVTLGGQPGCFIRSAEWIAFVAAFLFALWFFFKDILRRLDETESNKQEKYIKLLTRATITAEEAVNIARETLSEMKKLKEEQGGACEQ